MPQVKFSVSALGSYLVPKIKAVLDANAKASSGGITEAVAMEQLAQAIAVGVAAAWSSPMITSAFSSVLGIPAAPPAIPVTPGDPVAGTKIKAAIQSQCVEA
jgi:hypothetical protein